MGFTGAQVLLMQSQLFYCLLKAVISLAKYIDSKPSGIILMIINPNPNKMYAFIWLVMFSHTNY